MITQEEYQKIKKIIEEKALALKSHENKNSAKTGFPIQNYSKYNIDGRTFFLVKSNVFKEVIDRVYLEALEKFPHKFGTGNADDILEALYNTEPTIFDLTSFANFLQNEQFAYVLESKEGEILDKILRIDLFRKLDKYVEQQTEFTGGIFHAFKHFSINNINLSTGSDINNIENLENIIIWALKALFIKNEMLKTSTKLISVVDLNEKYCLKVVFYLEKITNVYFIKTIHKQRKLS